MWTRLRIRDRVAFACLLAAAASSTGCQSGWKMPGKDLFSWTKKPSESTLAGKGPSLTYPSNGPAANHTPNQIASGAPGSTRPSGVPGLGAPPTSMPNSAAVANNYPTGPYSTNSYGVPGGVGSAGAISAASNVAAAGAYGSSASSSPTYNGPSSPYGYRPSTTPYTPPTSGLAATSGSSQPGMTPNYGPQSLSNTGTGPSSMPGSNSMAGTYVPTGVGATPAFVPPSFGGTTGPNVASTGGADYNATASASMPSGVAAGGAYRPGTTGRATGYDFSTPSASAPTGAGQPVMMAAPPNPYAQPPMVR